MSSTPRRAPRRIRDAVAAALLSTFSSVHASENENLFGPPSCAGIARYDNTALSAVTVAYWVPAAVFVTAPRGDTRLFMVGLTGKIQIHKRGQAPTAHTTFLDITSKVHSNDGESGLVGLAFDPGYQSTLHFWIFYNEIVDTQIYSVVARYSTQPGNPDLADPASELRVLRFPKPDNNHNGGALVFGPDGFLYVTTGDGGGGGDQHGTCGNGQNMSSLMGKVLRIDVRGIDHDARPPDCGALEGVYGVPADNPLSDGPGGTCDEIWAAGFRNPWRASFDALTGDLFIPDVGQACWEELNWVPAGSPGGDNFGWRQKEGSHCFDPTYLLGCDPPPTECPGSPSCTDPSLVDPVLEYSHADGSCAVIGGNVYRGCRMPNWEGRYFYGDYCGGFVRTIRTADGIPFDAIDVTADLDPESAFPGILGSFGVDGQGELYVVTLDSFVRKIVPSFTELEVSATGTGAPFRLERGGDWTWENLYLATEVPVSYYRIYRGAVNGAYTCILKTTSTSWLGGDPIDPAPGELFAYVVTAVDASGQETEPGTTGTFNAATCP